MPMVVASSERSFLKLKLLKNYLRSTITFMCIFNCSSKYYLKKLHELIDFIEAIIDDFTSRNVREHFKGDFYNIFEIMISFYFDR